MADEKLEKTSRRRIWIVVGVLAGAVVLLLIIWALWWFNLWPFVGRNWTAEDFGIKTLASAVDFDGDGIDDYRDMMLGARKDAENHPQYDGSYVAGGFPDETKGVCTDVIWRAFREAGYDLREMLDRDVVEHIEDYPAVQERDRDIDFRRVANLEVFFDKYAQTLTNDLEDLEAWQLGDIVILTNGTHIGIVSDRRAQNGRPYIIHNAGQPNREEDLLKRDRVVKHYRFDASKIDVEKLMKWEKD